MPQRAARSGARSRPPGGGCVEGSRGGRSGFCDVERSGRAAPQSQHRTPDLDAEAGGHDTHPVEESLVDQSGSPYEQS